MNTHKNLLTIQLNSMIVKLRYHVVRDFIQKSLCELLINLISLFLVFFLAGCASKSTQLDSYVDLTALPVEHYSTTYRPSYPSD